MGDTFLNILQETLQYLLQEWKEKGVLEIDFYVIGNIDLYDHSYESMDCSCLRTEWDEGIYYEPKNGIFFFYGEPRAYTVEGNSIKFLITPNLSLLLSSELKAMLKQVAETQQSLIIKWNDSGGSLLEYK